MKIRNGFVSNSSTTTFMCDICGRTEAYHDSASYRDFGFLTCSSHDHSFCEDEALPGWEKKPRREDFPDTEDGQIEFEETEGQWDYGGGRISSKYCPICQMQEFVSNDVICYLAKKIGKTTEQVEHDVLQEIKKFNKRRKVPKNDEILQYLCKELDTELTLVYIEIKEKFSSYDELEAALS